MPDPFPARPIAPHDDLPVPEPRPFLTWRRLLVLVAVAILLVALVVFMADNFVLVQIRIFTLRIQARLAWALLVPLLLGIGLGWMAHLAWQRTHGWRNRTK
ncbi:MAG: LapA family protein [Thermomicrobiales bacterium]